MKSLKVGFSTFLDNSEENSMTNLVISVMGSIGELSRNQIKSKSMEGIKVTQALGKFKGRKIGTVQSDEKLLQIHLRVQKKLQKRLIICKI